MILETMFRSLRRAAIPALAAAAVLLSGCSNEIDDGNEQNGSRAASIELDRSTSVTLHVFGVPATIKNCNVWPWADITEGDGTTDDKNYAATAWPGDCAMTAEKIETYDAWSYTLSVDKNYQLGVLFVASDNTAQTGNSYIPKDKLQNNAEFYFVWNSNDYYTTVNECIGVRSAQITSADGNTLSVTVSLIDSIDKEKLVVKDSAGAVLSVESAGEVTDSKAEVTLSGGNIQKIPYTISYNGGSEIQATITSSIIEERFGTAAAAAADTLGVTVSGGKATFRTWAPVASSVEVLLYESAEEAGVSAADYENTGTTKTDLGTLNGNPVPMTLDSETGIWTAADVDFGANKYYKYKITNNGTTYYVCDIWAKAANADSYAAQITDINSDASAKPAGWEASYRNPFGNSGAEAKGYTDAVIYEMHIRDWSRAFVPDSTGKFDDIADALGADGSGAFAQHLKDLGVTHVQILPMFDYAQTAANTDYNWGYNPYHYNVPEGRYVNYGADKDGTDAVAQMRRMIKAFHDAGIAVNMDVVYNHTSGTGEGSLYDSTVPQYFYRMDATSGGYSNGSGCGNEVATDHVMVRKYVVESLKHWMNDYHINGFRFDLMGLHETETMKEIYEELKEIDPNVMVYGEPWQGGLSPAENSVRKPVIDECWTSLDENGVACFNDDIRDAVKGAEAFSFWRGQVQGLYNDGWIVTGLLGSQKEDGGFTGRIGRSLNYAECHDNYTLYDKLVFSALGISDGSGNDFSAKFKEPTGDQLELVKKQDMLVAAYIILAQGTPFLNGGQEFLRTKKGNPDSYAPDTKGGVKWSAAAVDACNTIDLKRKNTYSDVYNTYKGLIALRKANPAAFGANTDATAATLAPGVTKYTAGDFTVYFNASDKKFSLALNQSDSVMSFIHHPSVGTASGYTKAVDVSSGTPTDAAVPTSVPAKSFVILKK